MSFSKIILMGNLGRDPELRYTPQGDAVCDFSMATNERRRDKSGEFQDVTTWYKITLWRQQAENAAKYLSKGRPVYIEGKLRVEEWTDRDNNQRYSLVVNATEMHFISGSREDSGGEFSGPPSSQEPSYTGGASSSSSASAGSSFSSPGPANDDDIPF